MKAPQYEEENQPQKFEGSGNITEKVPQDRNDDGGQLSKIPVKEKDQQDLLSGSGQSASTPGLSFGPSLPPPQSLPPSDTPHQGLGQRSEKVKVVFKHNVRRATKLSSTRSESDSEDSVPGGPPDPPVYEVKHLDHLKRKKKKNHKHSRHDDEKRHDRKRKHRHRDDSLTRSHDQSHDTSRSHRHRSSSPEYKQKKDQKSHKGKRE